MTIATPSRALRVLQKAEAPDTLDLQLQPQSPPAAPQAMRSSKCWPRPSTPARSRQHWV